MRREVVSLVSLLVAATTASPDGKYWWMGSGDAFGDSQENQVRLRLREVNISNHIVVMVFRSTTSTTTNFNRGKVRQEREREKDEIVVTPSYRHNSLALYSWLTNDITVISFL